MDDGCAAVIGLIVVGVIVIALVVYVILPISFFLLFGIAAAGAISGAAVAVKNFGELLIEAHKTVL